jgi:16S rRNA (adenine1518-N6/adenine1519-N6)-dimethyltransferase
VVGLLAAHGVRPSRALGQNFVVDPNTVRMIARLAGVGPGDRVVEIGAGVGSLTLALVETGAHVTAIETDRHLIPILTDVLDGSGVDIVEADATDLVWADALGDREWTLVANLPYNVGTPLVADVLDHVPAVGKLVVMLQREVADRLVADPSSGKSYGALSVKVASWARARRLATVGPSVFHPRPRVGSAVVEMVRLDHPAVPDDVSREALDLLVRSAFGHRRKMLRRSLAGVVSDSQFAAAGVAADARPEDLELADWVRLARTTAGP